MAAFDKILSWLGFWTFSLVALAILAGSALSELWFENRQLETDYLQIREQNDALAKRVSDTANQIAALDQDPQYAERIIQQELNLRKPGEETLRVISPSTTEPATAMPPTGRLTRQLDQAFGFFRSRVNRLWAILLSAGLLLAAYLISVGRAEDEPPPGEEGESPA